MYFDVDGKPVKRPHAGLPEDLLAPVINGPVTFADVTGVAERKLTTHPPPGADPRRVRSHVPPLASSTRATGFRRKSKTARYVRQLGRTTLGNDANSFDLISNNRKLAEITARHVGRALDV